MYCIFKRSWCLTLFFVKSLNIIMGVFWCFMIWEIKSRLMIQAQFKCQYKNINFWKASVQKAFDFWALLTGSKLFESHTIGEKIRQVVEKISLLLRHLVAIFGNVQCLKISKAGILLICMNHKWIIKYVWIHQFLN